MRFEIQRGAMCRAEVFPPSSGKRTASVASRRLGGRGAMVDRADGIHRRGRHQGPISVDEFSTMFSAKNTWTVLRLMN